MQAPPEHDISLMVEAASVAIRAAVSGDAAPEIADAAELDERYSGVFITIHIHDELRGCIGYVSIPGPFLASLSDVARKSASEDLRFQSVAVDELEQLEFDITLLSKPEKIDDNENFVIGEHGLILESGAFRGLLLPQVPVEQGWNKHEFLDALCKKAMLPAGSWNDEAVSLSRFGGFVLIGARLQ